MAAGGTITVAGRRWPVRLVRHARARTLRLRLDAARGELRLTLPSRASAAAAMAWAERQQDWLAGQQEKQAVEPVAAGTILPIHGQPRRIVTAPELGRRVRLDAAELLVGGPPEAVARRLLRWLRGEAAALLADEAAEFARVGGLALGRVGVGDPRSRWGSCTRLGDIRFSWRLMLMPAGVRRAIVAHEVAHLAHMNHGPEFHALAAHLLGSPHRDADAWLRAHGAALHRFRFDR